MDIKYLKWLAFGLVIVLLLLFFIEGIVAEYKLANDYRITVSTTTGHSSRGWVDFEFTVNNVVYKGSNKGLSLKSKNAKYFVKYYAPDPSALAKVVSDIEVPKCIGDPPSNGWKEVPECKK